MGWVTQHHPDADGLASCVQCGLCLPVCPTFRLTGRETASPRGRLQAMTAVQDDLATVDAKFSEILGFCLGCRACEPICPGMVPYGALLEGARAEIVAQQPSLGRSVRGLLVGRALGAPALMAMTTHGLSMIQRLGLKWLLPKRFRRSFAGLRPLRDRPSAPAAMANGTVGLLTGCIQGQWFRSVNLAAVDLLSRAGFAVSIPQAQTCCGALAAHDGHASAAERFAAKNEAAFRRFDQVVATAAGCSAHLHDHDPARVADITVMVAEAIQAGQLPTLTRGLGPVVVQDPCHLRHAQRVVDEPRRILLAAGYDVVDLDDAGLCCGAAGLYTVLEPEASASLGDAKSALIRETGHSIVASANPGCEMQLRSHLGPEFRIAHPIELYLEAIVAAESGTNVDAVDAIFD